MVVSGRLRRRRKSALCPFFRIGFHRIDLVALEAAQLGSAGSIRHRYQSFIALGAAGLVHESLPHFAGNLG
jgi:hypothetical protein